MRGIVGQFLAGPLCVAVGVIVGRWIDRPDAGLLVGLTIGPCVSVALGLSARRRLRRISAEAELGREGREPHGHDFAMRDEIDRVASDVWRLASESSRRLSRDHAQIEQQGFLIDRMRDGLMRVAADGTVLFANITAGAMFGGRNPTQRSFIRVTRDHELNEALLRCLRTGNEQHLTLEIPGDHRLISAHISLLRTQRPEALVVLRDITEVSRLQQLRRDFVANVSHELRTPLSTIKILTETLLELRDSDAEILPFLEKIDAEVDAMAALVRDLLDLARLEAPAVGIARKPVEAGGLIRDVSERMASLAGRQQVTLETQCPPEPLIVQGDERRLHQALLNLTRNAIDHTPAGGRIVVSANASGDEVVLAVEDSGSGIAPEDLPRVWERFFKADRARTEGGTGLGLAIVKHIAQAHGGTVGASSALGKGSRFEIRLPRDYHSVIERERSPCPMVGESPP
ncbi:MAG: hypothetical protein DCC58_14670 [Chloroflexi bacterium]|nr:MAG: hypothetical protein DCC58_14670 [Chloroflexota bacterium]